MRYFQPDYVSEFHCIQSACRHSCCKGWEIDIDEDTLCFYRQLPGALGEKLRAQIEEGEDGAHFRLDERERCPFLEESGLCELIRKLGEGALCRICADHPRFRSFFPDREELGLGLCCEEAARLILTREAPFRIVELSPDEEAVRPLSERQTALLDRREKLLALAQDRSMSLEERLRKLWAESHMPAIGDYGRWAAFLLRLESLDPAWGEALSRLRDKPCAAPLLSEKTGEMGERLLCYLLYRHLPHYPVRGVGYAVFITELLLRLHAAGTELGEAAFPELCRLYSAEIEYSDENIGRILHRLYRR